MAWILICLNWNKADFHFCVQHQIKHTVSSKLLNLTLQLQCKVSLQTVKES